jgi:hypothetical protein
MANDESTRGGGKDELPEGIEQFRSVAREGERGSAGNDLEPRGGIPGKGFGGGGSTAYGDDTGAYRGESSYGGQAGYGGSQMNPAYSDGRYGRDQGRMHAAGDAGAVGDASGSVEDRQRGVPADEEAGAAEPSEE